MSNKMKLAIRAARFLAFSIEMIKVKQISLLLIMTVRMVNCQNQQVLNPDQVSKAKTVDKLVYLEKWTNTKN